MATATAESSSSEFSDQLADELEKLEHSANGSHVELEIVGVRDWERGDREVTVAFDPPLGEPFERSLAVSPDPNHPAAFNRLLGALGHNYDSAPEMIGDRVPARYDGEWHIDCLNPDLTRRERVRDWFGHGTARERVGSIVRAGLFLGIFAYWPVTGLPILFLSDLEDEDDGDNDDDDEDDSEGGVGERMVWYVLGLCLWTLGFLLFSHIAHMIGIRFPVEVFVTL